MRKEPTSHLYEALLGPTSPILHIFRLPNIFINALLSLQTVTMRLDGITDASSSHGANAQISWQLSSKSCHRLSPFPKSAITLLPFVVFFNMGTLAHTATLIDVHCFLEHDFPLDLFIKTSLFRP